MMTKIEFDRLTGNLRVDGPMSVEEMPGHFRLPAWFDGTMGVMDAYITEQQ